MSDYTKHWVYISGKPKLIEQDSIPVIIGKGGHLYEVTGRKMQAETKPAIEAEVRINVYREYALGWETHHMTLTKSEILALYAMVEGMTSSVQVITGALRDIG